MNQYKIITDATCDMNLDVLNAYGIDVIPMEVNMDDGKSFMHYPDFRNFAAKDFYAEQRNGNMSHSTQITPNQYLEFFRPYLEKGENILYVCFSSGLSNTYQSSLIAQQQLSEEFSDVQFVIVDSLCASGGEGVFAVQAGINQQNGMSLEENAKWLEENRLNLAHYFTVGDLTYLHKGGRVGTTTMIIGNALNIKPILHVDDEGKLVMLTTSHGRKSSIKKLLSLTQQTIQNPEDQILYISHTDCYGEAVKLKEMVMAEIPCKDVIITTVGPVVGTHTGPALLCLFSFGTGRKPN